MDPKDLTEKHIALQMFPGYSESDKQILNEFRNPDAKPEPGFIVDFLGSRIRISSVWNAARTLDGVVTGIPDPGDFHAEAIEWIGLLKAVRSADKKYVAMELGAGFGPWSVAGGVAAKRRGIEEIRLYAVEGDTNHFQFLRQHFIDNGFDPDEHVLFEAAVGAFNGEAQWPIVENTAASEDYGCRPMLAGENYSGRKFQGTKRVSMIALRDLVVREPVWDLIHIDVQGHEVEICRSCVEELNSRVRWIITGTHSRKLDGDLLDLMYSAGWILEHEKPARFSFVAGAPSLEAMTLVDGTQVWRNPRLVLPQSRGQLTSFAQQIRCSIDHMYLRPNDSVVLGVEVKNTSPEAWTADRQPVNLGYRWVDDQGKLLASEGTRTALGRPAIQPGESDLLQLRIVAPSTPGAYTLWISMVQEGVAWFYMRGASPCMVPATIE